MNTDEKILQALENLQAGQTRLEKDVSTLKDGQAHLTTAVEALKTGQDDIQENMATKEDIHRLETKIDKVAKDVKGHASRLENLEEHTGTPNPHKN